MEIPWRIGSPGTIYVKIFIEKSQMAKVPNGVETLPKILIAWVGRTNVTDDRRQTDGRIGDDKWWARRRRCYKVGALNR